MDRDVQLRAGLRLRRRRETRQWRREDVASRARVSTSLLAQFERGEANPSLATLARLADAVGLTLSELVAADDDDEPTFSRIEPTVMWEGRGDSRSVLLAAASGRIEAELWRYDLEPGDAYEGDAHLRGSQILIHVLAGTLELTRNPETASFAAGESVRLHSDAPHRYANSGSETLSFVLAYTRDRGGR